MSELARHERHWAPAQQDYGTLLSAVRADRGNDLDAPAVRAALRGMTCAVCTCLLLAAVLADEQDGRTEFLASAADCWIGSGRVWRLPGGAA